MPTPGSPPISTSDPGDEAAAEHPVELADAGREPRRGEHVDVAEQADGRRADRAAGARRRRPHRLLVERVPDAAARAAAKPLGVWCPQSEQTKVVAERATDWTIVAAGSAVTRDPPKGV